MTKVKTASGRLFYIKFNGTFISHNELLASKQQFINCFIVLNSMLLIIK